MKLQDALRKVIRRYGMSIIEDKRVMAFLADYKAFDEFPAVKPVMKAIAEGGYGRELCRLAADESDAEYLRYAAGLKTRTFLEIIGLSHPAVSDQAKKCADGQPY